MRQAHDTQHMGRLGELNIVVADDLYPVAPGVAKIKERPVERRNAGGLEGFAGGCLVIDDQTEVAAVVGWLPAAFLQGNELVAQVDEGHRVALAAQFELEEAAIERQRLIDVAHLQRNVIETYGAGLCELGHANLLCRSDD